MNKKSSLVNLLILIASFIFSLINEFLIRIVAIFFKNIFLKGEGYTNFYSSINGIIYGPLDSLGFVASVISQSILLIISVVIILKILKSRIDLLKVCFYSFIVSVSLYFFSTPKNISLLVDTSNFKFFLLNWTIFIHAFLVFILLSFLLKKLNNTPKD